MNAQDKALKSLQDALYMYRCQREKFPDYLKHAKELCRNHPELLAIANSLEGFASNDEL